MLFTSCLYLCTLFKWKKKKNHIISYQVSPWNFSLYQELMLIWTLFSKNTPNQNSWRIFYVRCYLFLDQYVICVHSFISIVCSWKLWSAYDTGRSGQYQTYLKLGSPTEYKSRELAFGSQVSCATSTTPIASGGVSSSMLTGTSMIGQNKHFGGDYELKLSILLHNTSNHRASIAIKA